MIYDGIPSLLGLEVGGWSCSNFLTSKVGIGAAGNMLDTGPSKG